MSFIANLVEFSLVMFDGGTHIIVPGELRRDPPNLVRFMTVSGATISSMPPALAPAFRGTCLKVIGVQGQAQGIVRVPGIKIVNIYGCSEMGLV